MMPEPNPGMPAAGGPPPSVVYLPMPAQPTVYENYLSDKSILTGRAQIVIGALCIMLNIIAAFGALGYIAHGFWCGILFIVTGCYGILAARSKTRCQIIAYMVLCIISASFTLVLFIVAIIAASCGNGMSAVTESFLVIAAIVEAVVAIYAAVICCRTGPGCCGNPDPQTVIPGGFVPNNGQLVYISQTEAGQFAYLPQPMMGYPSGSAAPPPPFASINTQSECSIPPPYIQSTGSTSAQATSPPAYTAEYTENSKTTGDTTLLWP